VRPIPCAVKNLSREEIHMSSSTAALTTNTEATPERVKVGRSGPMDQMSSPASSPLALSDEQLNMVMRLAEPLHPRLRRAFVEHVAVALRGQTIGDGSLHRACAKVLKEMFDPPLETTHESKWAR
jgi:hypothetical protein